MLLILRVNRIQWCAFTLITISQYSFSSRIIHSSFLLFFFNILHFNSLSLSLPQSFTFIWIWLPLPWKRTEMNVILRTCGCEARVYLCIFAHKLNICTNVRSFVSPSNSSIVPCIRTRIVSLHILLILFFFS